MVVFVIRGGSDVQAVEWRGRSGCPGGAPDRVRRGVPALDSDRKAAVPEASAESSPSAPTDPRPTEERAVLAAYEGMWRELAVAVQKASEEGTRIEDYASGEALATVRRDVRTMREAGTRANG